MSTEQIRQGRTSSEANLQTDLVRCPECGELVQKWETLCPHCKKEIHLMNYERFDTEEKNEFGAPPYNP